jgi:hypothetical protein
MSATTTIPILFVARSGTATEEAVSEEVVTLLNVASALPIFVNDIKLSPFLYRIFRP